MTTTDAPLRVIFMGTPEFAVPPLRALALHAEPGDLWPAGLALAGVVTRPDKTAGRGRQAVHSPVKRVAQDLGIAVLQPGSLRRTEAFEQVRALAPDLIVVAAFGQLLPPSVLALPRFGCLNIHASLLPRHRGAAPINAAIFEGDAETGVTLMLMEEGLDTGPMIAKAATPIRAEETAGDLFDRLATLGGTLLIETLPRWLRGEITPEPQDESRATLTRPLTKEDGRLDWTGDAARLARQVRAFTPWPGAYTTWEGKQLKVLRAHEVAEVSGGAGEPGRCYLSKDEGGARLLCCVCGSGSLALDVIQLEGRRALAADESLRGHPALATARLGA
jgi:methionyl-tRNA formyltransferase